MENKQKKQVLLVGIIIVIITVPLVVGLLIGNAFKEKEENLPEEKQELVEDNKDEEEEEEEQSVNDTPVEGLKGKTLDYYWNIDTQSFDKSKFDGKISFYGNVVNGKITTDKLKEVGIEIKQFLYSERLKYNSENEMWYFSSPFLLKNGESLESSTSGAVTYSTSIPYIINYRNSDIYSEHSYVILSQSFGWNLTKYKIYPNVLGVEDVDDINIDLVLEKLGNPTYVNGRTNINLENIYGYTTYLYLYDEVAFLFAFYNSSDLDLAAVYYYPIETFQQEDSDGKTALDKLEEQYQKYLSSK